MDSFWEACGARGPLTIEVEGGGAPATRHVLDRPFALIGSGPRSDLLLGHPEVSRRHAYLQVIAGRPFCVDLESRTGTHVEGGTPAGGWVDPGGSVRIGPYRVRATVGGRVEGPAQALEPDPLSGRGPGARSRLEVEGPGEPRTLRVARTLSLIGGSGRCKIRLATAPVSRFLGALLRTPGGDWVVDLRSSGGLVVNGVRLAYARLESGDEIRLGPLVARLGVPKPARARDRLPSTRAASTEVRPTIVPPDPSAGELREFLEQVADIQQHSGDQFRRAIVMLTQHFGSMHRETLDLVREELEQVRVLVGELKSLRDHSDAGRAPAPGSTGGRPSKVGPDPGEPGPAPPRDPGEIHLIVGERLAAFERERRGRWDRLSGLLGKSGP